MADLRCFEPTPVVQASEIDRVAGLLGQLLEILQLRAAVALTERMDVVDVAKNDGGLLRKARSRQACEKSRPHQPTMDIAHAGLNILPELELLGIFADLDRAQFAGPIVDILEQMAMNGLQMSKIEGAAWNAFSASLDNEASFVSIEDDWVSDPETIFEGPGTGIDVRIVALGHLSREAVARATM